MVTAIALFILAATKLVPTQISPAGFSGVDPQVVAFENRVYVVCGNGDRLFLFRSSDRGNTFSAPIPIPTSGHLALGMRRGPRIAVTKSAVVITAVYGLKGGGRDGDLVSFRSTDNGNHWVGPARVNDSDGSAREGLHAMASSSDGRIACTWLDLRNKGTEVWASASSDGGASWTKNSMVYRSPDGHVCECCHPSIQFSPTGDIAVMFRNALGGYRDMFLSRSSDNGKSFKPAQKLGIGSWLLNYCPMDGGAISFAEDGAVTSVWRRKETSYICRPGQPEIEVGPGTQPWIANSKSGPIVTWQSLGQIMLKRGADQPMILGPGSNPAITSTSGGAFAVWADPTGRIFSLRVGQTEGT